MANILKQLVTATAFFAVSVTSAQAACWSPAEISAAKVRDFEAMLRSASVRCGKETPALKADYNQFVRISRPAFAAANTTIRGHFTADDGVVGSFSAYNQFLATITTSYGAGADGLNCADFTALLTAANAEGASATSLARLADQAGAAPTLVGQRCSNRVIAGRAAAIQQVAIK